MKPILKTKFSLVGASAALAFVLSGCAALEQITGGPSEAVEAEAVETDVEVEVEVEVLAHRGFADEGRKGRESGRATDRSSWQR